MNEREFTDGFVAYVKANMPEVKFEERGDLTLHFDDVSGLELDLSLDNAYTVYTSGTRDLELVYQDVLASIKNFERASNNTDVKSILPVIKPVSYIDSIKAMMQEKGEDSNAMPLYVEQLNVDLYQLYVFDSPDSMRFVTPEDVETLNISEFISTIASKNLAQFFEQVGAGVEKLDTGGRGNLYQFTADENYAASILAGFDDIKADLPEIKGQWVVFVPARNVALLADAEDGQSIETASYLAAKGYEELGYAISPYGYVLVEGKWGRFVP
jgi:uncharacterized protein YtpQ (UPF0354 family)